jgi:DNA-binding transcriptional LysR family regulator
VASAKTHRYKELRSGHLRAFREVVRRKSFAKAARALGIAHPTLWEQVRALERTCGAVLLERHGREWKPTEDGLLALEMANSVVDVLDSFQERFRKEQDTLPRQLIFSCVPGILTEDLAEPIVAFCQAYPRIRLLLPAYHGGSERDVANLIESGEADLGSLVLPHGSLSVLGPMLRVEPLSQRPAALFLPHGHPLATRRRLTLADLVRYPLILPEAGGPWRQRVDAVFRDAGLLERQQVLLEVGVTHAARRYVSRGLGVALFPLPRDAMKYPGLEVRILDNLLPPEDVVLVWRRAGKLRPQAQLFIDFVRAHLAEE